MNAPSRIESLAAKLIDAHRTRVAFAVDAADTPVSAADAYRVQDLVASRLWSSRGDPLRAWKTGAPDARTTPIAAPIPASKLHRSPVVLDGNAFNVIGIEAELAYTLARDLPPRTAPYTEDDVVPAIASVHAAIEICDSRYANWQSAGPLAKLADSQMNGALVVGAPVSDWRSIDPAQQAVIVEFDRVRHAEAIGAHPFGNPLRVIPWLADHCAARCGGLRAGDVITTGAWAGMPIVQPGTRVVVRFPGIGDVDITFTPSRTAERR